MTGRSCWILLLFILQLSASGQSLRIIDTESKKPVSDVYVYNEAQTTTRFSGADGTIDLNGFTAGEILFFQHPAYENKRINYDKLESNGFKVQLTQKIITFTEVVVAANKWEQDAEKVSQDILFIDSKSIEFGNPQTSADLLQNTGEIFVQKSQYGGGSPSLRGFAANKVLLVVDGIRLNNAIYRSGNLQNVINIDPNAIDQAEVVFGPGSVIYGSDALGGVMDFHTKSPAFSIDDSPLYQGTALMRLGSAAKEKTAHVDFGVGWRKIAYWGSFSNSYFDDLEAGSNRSDDYAGYFSRDVFAETVDGQDVLLVNQDPDVQKFSGYDLTNTIHKLSFRFDNNSNLTYGFYFSTTSDIPRYDRLVLPVDDASDSLEYAEWFYGPQKWTMHSLSYGNFNATSFYDQMKITTSFQNYEESRNDRAFGSNERRTRTEKVKIFTGSLDFEKLINEKATLFYGVDGFYNDVRSTGIVRDLQSGQVSPTSPRYPDGGSQFSSLAAYSSLQYAVSEKLNLNLGARYNTVWLAAKTSNVDATNLTFDDVNVTNQAVTGSIGTIYIPGESSKLSLLVSSGFRAPNVDDVGKLFELDDEIIVVPNPELKPEYVYSQEISYQQKLNPVTQVDFVVYNSYLTNAIIRGAYDINDEATLNVDGVDLEIRSQVNSDKAHIYGGSIRFKSKLLNHLALTSSISMNEGKDLDTKEPLRHSTPVFGQTQLKFNKDNFRLTLIGDYNFKRNREDIPATEIEDKPHLYTDEGSPGWYTLDIRSSYYFRSGLEFEGGIENIMDRHYRPYSSGISGPGRNFYLTGKYKF